MSRWRTLDGTPTRVIAHRGASGPLPEHTLAAYNLALEQGADVIEPDLVSTRDGSLMVRHDRHLSRSTDVATRPEFATRQCDGDWWIEQFSRDDLALLRAIQPFPQRDHSHDGQSPIPEFGDVLVWAEGMARQRGATVRLYPELKHVAHFESLGLDPVAAFINAVRAGDADRVAIQVQCFEIEPLRRVRAATELPTFLLLDERADWRAAMFLHGSELSGLGVAKSLLRDARGADSGLVSEAHARGLQVHAWTYRDDVLPSGIGCVEDELDLAFGLGVDAVFCDFPATALARRVAHG
jgi:glycerophosphoryl diester phosphodiesterase